MASRGACGGEAKGLSYKESCVVPNAPRFTWGDEGTCRLLDGFLQLQRPTGASASWAPRRRASDYCERAQANATRAAPRHMPVPMRCTKSTARMVARVG